MARFLFRGTYTVEGTKGVIKGGGGTARRTAVQEALRPLGGEVESFYFGLGDDDVFVIAQVPDNISAAAVSLAVNSAGGATVKTTVLLTPEEIDRAAQMVVKYRAPGQ